MGKCHSFLQTYRSCAPLGPHLGIKPKDSFLLICINTLTALKDMAFVLCRLFKCVPPFQHKTVERFMKANDGKKRERKKENAACPKICHKVNENNM